MTKPPRGASGRVDWGPWRKMKGWHLALYPECRACGTEERVVVHHVRYRGQRGRSERPGDLLTLCAACHDDLHRRLGSTPSLERQLAWLEQTRALL